MFFIEVNKIFGLLFVLFVIGGLAFYVLKNYFPEIIPPSKDIKQYLPLDENTLSPIKIENGYILKLFYNLKNNKPLALSFGSNGDLLVHLKSGKVISLSDKNMDMIADSESDSDEVIVLDNGLTVNDTSGNSYSIEENKLVKYKTFAGSISDKTTILSGFTQTSGEMIGNLKHIIMNDNNLFIADDKTNLIYILTQD